MDYLINEYKKVNTKSDTNKFDDIIKICETYYNKPVNNMFDLKKKNPNLKGEIFECFTFLYLKNHYNLIDVWATNKNNYCDFVPTNIRDYLKLGKRDMGIDFVGRDIDNNFYAIQAKYRKRTKDRKTTIPWKQLCTFYGLVLKTGPYKKHIIITNADSVTHVGYKTEKDETIGYNKLSKINHFEWMKIFDILENKNTNENIINDNINNTNTNNTNINNTNNDEIRSKRLLYFDKQLTTY